MHFRYEHLILRCSSNITPTFLDLFDGLIMLAPTLINISERSTLDLGEMTSKSSVFRIGNF